MAEQNKDLIPLDEAQELLPAGPDGTKPTIRWISEEARRLGCYRRVGRNSFIEAGAWRNFIWGIPWLPSASLKLDHLAEALLLARSARRSTAGFGYVYFIDARGMTKIGFSASHPRSRLKQLQTASPFSLHLWGYARGEFDLESSLHHRLADRRVHGEWFALSDEDRASIASVIKETKGYICKGPDNG